MRAEVYDQSGKELVGYLEGVADLKASRANSVTVVLDKGSESDPFMGGFLSPPPYRPAEYIALEIGRLSRRFDRSLMIRDPRDFEAMIASVIPEHAESVQDIDHNSIIYHWKVLKVPPKPEDAEKLFEMPGFEPEGESCASWAAEERWWAKRGSMPGLHRGGSLPKIAKTTIAADLISSGAITADQLASLASDLPMYGQPMTPIRPEPASKSVFDWRTLGGMSPMKPKPIINPGGC